MNAEPPGAPALVGPAVPEHDLVGLFRDLPDAVVLLDTSARVMWGNEAAEELFGRTTETSVGISALEFVHPDDLPLVMRSLSSVQQKTRGTLIEVRVSTAIGWRLLEVLGRAVPQFDPPCILFCLRDITDRRRFEVARGNDAKFRSLLQNAAFVTMCVAPDGRIESASAAITRAFGHDPEQLEGRQLVEIFAEEDRADIRRSLEEAVAGGTGAEATVEARCLQFGSDRTIPVEVTIGCLLDDPTVGGFVVSIQDVSRRQTAEAGFRGLLEAAPDAVVVVREDGAIALVNRRTEEMFGYRREALIGRELELLVPHEQREGHLGHRAQFVADPHTGPMGRGRELYALRRDGTRIPVEISLSSVRMDQRTLIFASVRDIFERKQVEAELRDARAQSAASEERRRIARELHDGLAHELAFIASKTRSWVGESPGNLPMRELMNAADRALDEARRAISVLSATRSETLEHAITETAEQLGARFGIDIRVTVDEAGEVLRPATENLLRIIREAVTNAAIHGHPDRITVMLRCDREVCLIVRDDGVGFDPSWRPNPSGFGLISMRERAELIGGQLHVRSVPGQGTEVEFTMPVPPGLSAPWEGTS